MSNVTTLKVAWDMYHEGYDFTCRTLMERYGINSQRAGEMIRSFEKCKRYTTEITRDGRQIVSVRILKVAGTDTHYNKVRQALIDSDEPLTTHDIVERYGVNQNTAGHIMFKLRKDPTIQTETVQKGCAIAVKISRPEQIMSRESELWRVITTGKWSDLRGVVA